MSPSGIRMNPGAIDRSASAAAARALAIDEVAGAITSVSLAGLEPKNLGRTVSALERATKLAQRASGITGHQGPRLRKRAALARAADEGGWKPKPWDSAKWIRTVGQGVLGQYSKLLELETKAAGKAWDAKTVYRGQGPMGRKLRQQFTSWQAMQKRFRKTAPLRAERTALLRKIHQFNVQQRLTDAAKAEWIKRKGINKRPSFLGKLGGKALSVAGKAVGPVAALATSVAKGEPLSVVAQRFTAATIAVGADVVVGAVGGTLCAAATIGSGGPGALACPAIVGATAAVAGIATAQILNHQIDKRQPKPKPKPHPSPAGGDL